MKTVLTLSIVIIIILILLMTGEGSKTESYKGLGMGLIVGILGGIIGVIQLNKKEEMTDEMLSKIKQLYKTNNLTHETLRKIGLVQQNGSPDDLREVLIFLAKLGNIEKLKEIYKLVLDAPEFKYHYDMTGEYDDNLEDILYILRKEGYEKEAKELEEWKKYN